MKKIFIISFIKRKKCVKGALATRYIKNLKFDFFCSINNESEIVKKQFAFCSQKGSILSNYAEKH